MPTPPPGQPLQQRVTLTLDQLAEVTCENESCKGNVFFEGIMLREVSPLISGEAEPKLAPIPVFICASCGGVLQKYLPPALRKPKIVA